MTTVRQYKRCPHTRLTQHQTYVLTEIAQRHKPRRKWPHGIVRSLVMRGLVSGSHRLTDEGREALLRCSWLSVSMRRLLANGSNAPTVP